MEIPNSVGRATRGPKSSSANEAVEDNLEQQSLLDDASPSKNAPSSPCAATEGVGVQVDDVSAVLPEAEAEVNKSPTSQQSQDDLGNHDLFSFPPNGRGNIRVRYEDYKSVVDHDRLKDPIIDFWITVFQSKLKTARPEKQYGDSLYCFSALFFSRLRPNSALSLKQVDFDGVKRWTANVGLFANRCNGLLSLRPTSTSWRGTDRTRSTMRDCRNGRSRVSCTWTHWNLVAPRCLL